MQSLLQCEEAPEYAPMEDHLSCEVWRLVLFLLLFRGSAKGQKSEMNICQ